MGINEKNPDLSMMGDYNYKPIIFLTRGGLCDKNGGLVRDRLAGEYRNVCSKKVQLV